VWNGVAKEALGLVALHYTSCWWEGWLQGWLLLELELLLGLLLLRHLLNPQLMLHHLLL
jgi:hypothetical protein